MFFFHSFFLVILATIGKTEDLDKTLSACKCQAYASCTWATVVVPIITSLPSNHPNHIGYKRFFTDRICDSQEQFVWCCRDGDYPTKPELQLLNKKDEAIVSVNILLYTMSI